MIELVILIILVLIKLLEFKLNFIIIKRFITIIFIWSIKLYCLEGIWGWIYYLIGIDKFSYLLIILIMWLILCIMISRGLIYKNKIYLANFNFLLLIIIITLILTFLILNILIFYIFFETRIIPVFLLILGWGYQPERLRARLYMLLYTLTASIPLLTIIYLIYLKNWELRFVILLIKNSVKIKGGVYFLILIIVFFVKTPIFLFHIWLPKAHVEAPVRGSIILAGVILKLGTYGILRVLFFIEKELRKIYSWILILRIIGGIYMGIIRLIQIDLKILVAYSSVVHIRILIISLLTRIRWGYLGGYLIIIGHGLCSSGLFVLVNINYERLERRNLILNKGLVNISPKLTLWWFLICSSNMGVPPSLNLIGEIIILIRLIYWRKNILFYLIVIIFIRTLYNLYIYSYSQHGDFNINKLTIFINVKINEYLVVIIHWIPINLIILKIKNYV